VSEVTKEQPFESALAKILPFPTLRSSQDSGYSPSASSPGPEGDRPHGILAGAARVLTRRPLLGAGNEPPAGGAGERSTPGSRPPLDPRRRAGALSGAPDGRPSAMHLRTWLQSLQRGGLGYVYWNAAKLTIAGAIERAVVLPDDAMVDVEGHRVFVVEPLRRPTRRVDDTGAGTATS
jgi:hypothetical protein